MAYTNASAGSAQAGVVYSVKKNALLTKQKGSDTYTAVVDAPALSLEALAERMVRQGSAYSARDIISIVDEVAEVMAQVLNEGNAVNLGSICRFRPSIKGTLASDEAVLTSADNPVVVTCSAGSMIKSVAANATTLRVSSAAVPTLLGVADLSTGTAGQIASDAAFLAFGERMTWDTAADDEGFFVVASNGDEVKCTVNDNPGTGTVVTLMATLTGLSSGAAVNVVFRTRQGAQVLRSTQIAATIA